MRILIAGGAGYVGSALVPQLAKHHDVVVSDLLWFGNHLPSHVPVICQNIFDITEEQLRHFDQVIFLGGLSNDPMAEFSPSLNFIHNAAAPAYLAYVAKRAGVKRYVYASSCSVYGFTQNELYDETGPTTCEFPYGQSKLMGERAVLQMVDPQFSVIALRKGTISGYSPRMRLDLIVNTMFKSACRDGVITVSNPKIWRPVLSMNDAVRAYRLTVEAAPQVSGVFNITSVNVTVGDVALAVRDRLRNAEIEVANRDDKRNYKVRIDRASEVLGYRPNDDLAAIVRDLSTNSSRFCDWDSPNYYNIQVLKNLLDFRANL